jgi:hypothetical protein
MGASNNASLWLIEIIIWCTRCWLLQHHSMLHWTTTLWSVVADLRSNLASSHQADGVAHGCFVSGTCA